MNNELANNLNELMNMGHGFLDDFGDSFLTDDSTKDMKSDITESDKGYQVTVYLPGVDKDNIDLSYHDGNLSIKAKRDSSIDRKDEKGNVLASERSYGQFVRNYYLPNVDADKISAKSDQGVLTIDLAKDAKKETGHKIEIG